jgi:hypothetical protein
VELFKLITLLFFIPVILLILFFIVSVFIVLKLVGVINWSWALVLMPLWIGLGLAVLGLLVVLVALLARLK